MRFKAPQIIIVIVALVSPSLVTLGQRADANGDRIGVLREEIRKRETADVPLDLKEMNRSKLLERRAGLLTLLRVEIDNLKRYVRDLGSSMTPQEKDKVDDAVKTYQTEIRSLASAMQSDLAKELGTDAPPPAIATLQTANSESNSGRSISDSNLSGRGTPTSSPKVPPQISAPQMSAAPNTGTSLVPGPAANPTAAQQTPVSSEESKDQTAPLDCKEARDPANSKRYSQLDKMICGLPRSIVNNRKANPTNRLFLTGTTDYFELVKIMIAKKDPPGFLVDAEETRLDKQVGSSAVIPGHGLLALKGGAPAIFGFAVENGALERSVNGSLITFRGNPVGIINALSNQGFI